MVYIYVLKLEKNKYYIGKTNNPHFRLTDHFNNNGSEWTRKYKPIELLELISNCDDYDEDKYTRKYMDLFGINNVRGGSFSSVKLDNETLTTLIKMSLATNDKCFNCGEKGHFAKDCDDYVWLCEYCEKEFDDEDKCIEHEIKCKKRNKCDRCGRSSHNISNCYAKTHNDGYDL